MAEDEDDGAGWQRRQGNPLTTRTRKKKTSEFIVISVDLLSFQKEFGCSQEGVVMEGTQRGGNSERGSFLNSKDVLSLLFVVLSSIVISLPCVGSVLPFL